VRVLRSSLARPVGGVSFGPGDRTLIAGGSGGFDLWDLATNSRTFFRSHSVRFLYVCAYDPLGRWVYVSDYLGGFRLLPVGGKESQPTPGDPYERHVISFGITHDGRRFVLSRGGAGSNRVECWRVSPTGRFAAVWSIRDGKPVAPQEPYLLNQATWSTNGVTIDRHGKTVVSAESRSGGSSGNKPLIVIRHGGNGKAVAELGESATGFDTRLAMAADGRAAYAWDNRVFERWDLKVGRCTGQLPAPKRAYFRGLAVDPSGRIIITVSGDGQARYWHPVDLSPVEALRFAVGGLNSVAVSASGKLAAAGGDKGQVVLWDVKT